VKCADILSRLLTISGMLASGGLLTPVAIARCCAVVVPLCNKCSIIVVGSGDFGGVIAEGNRSNRAPADALI
jgi:hypothetical protein